MKEQSNLLYKNLVIQQSHINIGEVGLDCLPNQQEMELIGPINTLEMDQMDKVISLFGQWQQEQLKTTDI